MQQTSFDFHRALVDGLAQHALYLLSPDGTILSWNRGAELLHGIPEAEAIGQHVSILYRAEEAHEAGSHLRRLAAGGVDEESEIRLIPRRGGDEFWAETSTSAIFGGDGELSGFTRFVRDGSQQKNLEKAVERCNEELSRFAFTVSHDLQEPLRTVRSYAELLERRYKGKLDADANDFIGFLVDASMRMSQLLRDILAYSQAGRPDRTRPEPVDSNNVLQWALMNLDAAVKRSGAIVNYEPLPTVVADQAQLTLVFQSLIDNSIKFRSEDPPTVQISAKQLAKNYWEFTIKDNGVGIDPQFHDRIFGVFKRLVGKDVPGTGIGLSISRKIVEAHGGRMWVESTGAGGTTFLFTLPGHE
jgi:PAS domain S-box-containing protein